MGNRTLSECRRVPSPTGRYLSASGRPQHRRLGPLPQLLGTFLVAPFVSQTLAPLEVKRSRELLLDLKELIEAGEVTPVMDGTYPLSQVPEATRYLEEGRCRGKVVITV